MNRNGEGGCLVLALVALLLIAGFLVIGVGGGAGIGAVNGSCDTNKIIYVTERGVAIDECAYQANPFRR